MAKPTQKELKSAVIDMLLVALNELQGTLDLEMGYFEKTRWFEYGIRPLGRLGVHLDKFSFSIDNPVSKTSPIMVKVTVPQPGQGE